MALALDKKLSSDEAVKKYKESAQAPVSTEINPKEKDTSKTAKKGNDGKKLSSKSNEKLTTNKKELRTINRSDTNTNSESKTKRKEINVAKNDIQLKKSLQLRNKNTSVAVTNKVKPVSDLKEDQNVTEKEKEEKQTEDNKVEEVQQLNVLSKTENSITNDDQINTTTTETLIIQSNDQEFQGKLKSSSYTIGENDHNSSLSSQDLMEVENSDRSTGNAAENADDIGYQENHSRDTFSVKESKTMTLNIEPALIRDDSIDSVDKSGELEKRKTFDKVISISSNRKHYDVVRPPSVRPSSSRPGAPRLREKIDNVISDNDNLLLAKVNIIAENTNNEDVSTSLSLPVRSF